jgi:hypothetical protein
MILSMIQFCPRSRSRISQDMSLRLLLNCNQETFFCDQSTALSRPSFPSWRWPMLSFPHWSPARVPPTPRPVPHVFRSSVNSTPSYLVGSFDRRIFGIQTLPSRYTISTFVVPLSPVLLRDLFECKYVYDFDERHRKRSLVTSDRKR